MGSQWSKIANELNNRSGNSVKNRFYTVLLKTYIKGTTAHSIIQSNNSNIENNSSVSSDTFVEIKTAKKNIFCIYSDSNKSESNLKIINEPKINTKQCFAIFKDTKLSNQSKSRSNENSQEYESNSNYFSFEEEASHSSMHLDFQLIETSSNDLNQNSTKKEDSNSQPTFQSSEYSDSCSISNFLSSIPKQNDIDIYSYGLPMSFYNKSGLIQFEEMISLEKGDIATLFNSQGVHGGENYPFPSTFN